MVRFGVFLKPEACSQSVLPDRLIGGYDQNQKIQMRHFGLFSNNVRP